MNNLSCFILDDDVHAIETIKLYAEQTPELNCIGTAESATVFLKQWREGIRPDLLFLDIEMPMMNGMDLARILGNECAIVFISGHPEYGADAFDTESIDFLRKPVSYARFYKAVNRAIKRIQSSSLHNKALTVEEGSATIINEDSAMLFKDDIFFIYSKEKGTMDLRRLSELLYIQALDTYIRFFFCHNKNNIFHRSLSSVELALPNTFIRVHRSYIVNTAFIRSVTSKEILLNGVEESVPIGKTFKQNIQRFVESRMLGNEY